MRNEGQKVSFSNELQGSNQKDDSEFTVSFHSC